MRQIYNCRNFSSTAGAECINTKPQAITQRGGKRGLQIVCKIDLGFGFPDNIKGGARKKLLDGLFNRALITTDGIDCFGAAEGYDAIGRARP